ncbi:hypothetical protein Y032_0979g3275 [Ancylostoma ceylanicum]|nr:hypothetical protein Y032_0979g3275 [Ancylostoma ceylanicum]
MKKFVFSHDTCGEILSLYKDLIYNVVLALLTMTIDVFSLVKLRSKSSKIMYAPGASTREKPWFLQATINSSLYVLMLASFHIADCFSGITTQFLLTVVSWQMWLSATPYSIIILQKEFQSLFRNMWTKTIVRQDISVFHLSTDMRSSS